MAENRFVDYWEGVTPEEYPEREPADPMDHGCDAYRDSLADLSTPAPVHHKPFSHADLQAVIAKMTELYGPRTVATYPEPLTEGFLQRRQAR